MTTAAQLQRDIPPGMRDATHMAPKIGVATQQITQLPENVSECRLRSHVLRALIASTETDQ